ncbi:NAD-dependent epimerase/dehydratase family protein [Salipiger sp.]|uniref:NAD-dependent epimerase/dehydratase family protein n=1 Tax=Salipiger sp. TaxID=2078585 RepID=UPI003A972A5E
MPEIAGGKFVVVGGASQIGATIAEQLLNEGAGEVVLVDNLSFGPADSMQPMIGDDRCSFVRADVRQIHELFDPLAGASGVFYVAGVMSSTIAKDPWLSLDVNSRGFQNALEVCRRQGVQKIVYSSSIGVYGASTDLPTTEESPLRWQQAPAPMALYFASKVASEAMARYYRDAHGLDYVALRYSSVYGERQHQRAMMGGGIAENCARVRRGEAPLADGDGTGTQDYVYVGDVARANLMAMESPAGSESFNIVGGVELTQNRVLEVILRAAGSDLEPVYRDYTGTAKLAAATRYVFDRQKARDMLGWEPRVEIEEGVARVMAWIDARA